MTRRILLIEDDDDIADLLALHLADIDAVTTRAADGVSGLVLGLDPPEGVAWDLVLLDLSLPRCDGLSIAVEIRAARPATPILMVTARDSDAERIAGFEAGADDYVGKPFNVVELMARIRALLRRATLSTATAQNLAVTAGDIVLDPVRHVAHVAGRGVSLTRREFELLLFLAREPGRVYRRSELLEHVWGHTHEGYLHTVNTHINRLRAKIEPKPSEPRYVTTVWGVGYRLIGKPSP